MKTLDIFGGDRYWLRDLRMKGRSNARSTSLYMRNSSVGRKEIHDTHFALEPAQVRKLRKALEDREAELVAAGYLRQDATGTD
jgi:hypothetical protein